MTHPSLRSTALVAAAACLLLPGSSHAWDSKIFSGADLHGRAAARTTYQAEHRPIMEQALNTGGHPQPGQWNLPFQVLVSTDATLFNDLMVEPWSLTPVEPDETLRLRTRTFTPSMFAELPDFSYSLLDWFSGNESCPPGAAAMGVAANDECYEFAGWMGTLNSTHFPPQSTTLHRYYNELAKGIGAQCIEYQAAMGYGAGGSGPIPPFMSNTLDCGADGLCPGDAGYTAFDVGELDGIDDFLQQCQALTLMLEAVAQHYLQDSWSSGHMWQRWGGPMPADVVSLPRGIMLAMTSGIIHGAKAITKVNDRMCAGSEWRYAWGSPGRNPAGLATVPTTIPDGSGAYNTGVGSMLFEGVGDLFMGDLNSGGGWIFSAGLPRYWNSAFQNTKTYDCAVMSTRQTYAAGPQIWGPMTSYTTTVPGTDDELCLAARATNKRFYEGSHLDIIPVPVPIPGTPIVIVGPASLDLDNFIVYGVVKYKAGAPGALNTALKAELKRIHAGAWAARNGDPNGYDLSTNTGVFALGPMLGVADNGGFNASVPPYVDPPAPWDGVQSSLAADPDEEMLLSAFNRSFAKHWCHRDNMDFEKLNNLRKRCQGLGSFGGLDADAEEANCRVCEEYSARHIRIGCSETDDTYTQTTNVLQPLCAELEDEANVDFLYLDIDPADPMAQDAGLAAADFCRSPTPNFAPCSDPWVGNAFGSGGCSQYYVQFFGWQCLGCGGCALSSSALGRIDSPFPVDDLNILWTATGDGYFSTSTDEQEDATLLWNILVPPTCGISASGSASISLQVCDPYYSSCSTNYDFASVTCSGY